MPGSQTNRTGLRKSTTIKAPGIPIAAAAVAFRVYTHRAETAFNHAKQLADESNRNYNNATPDRRGRVGRRRSETRRNARNEAAEAGIRS